MFAPRFVPRVACLALLAVLALALGACGGGSSTPTPAFGNADFVGTYQLLCLGGSRADSNASASFGYVTADGAGLASGMVGENLNSVASALSPTGDIPYLVQGDGTLLIDNLRGLLTNDGAFAVLGSYENGADPFVCLLIRRSGAYSNATLDGNYHLGGMAVTTASALSVWTGPGMGLGPVQFDGLGGGTYPGVNVNDNEIITTDGGGPSPYAIAADGVLQTDSTWFPPGLGAVTSDGVFGMTGGGPGGSAPFLQLLVEVGAGLDDATFSGEYAAFFLSTDLQPMMDTGFTSGVGRALANGAGTLDLVGFTLNEEQVVTAGTDDTETYTVSPDGRLVVGNLEGAVSADGRFAYLVGPNTADAPVILVMIRR